MSFEGAGAEPGLQLWRIEDFEAVPYSDESKLGRFHTGDSYIVLKTSQLKSGRFRYDIHFWLGAETSQDESGTAAIKSVELDDSLGGAPVQHREVQEHESTLFQSYFKKGLKYLPGGVKSGFRHVDPEDVVKRLFQVKGKRNIKVKECPVDISSLNKTDCFILDCGKAHDILVYMPPGARKMEKFRAIQAANEIRDEDHAGDANVQIIDEFEGEPEKFFEALGSGSPDEVAETSSEDDAEAELNNNRGVKLFKVSDADGGEVEVEQVSEKPLKQGMLNQSDCYILDTGSTNGIFAWIGKEATKEERVHAVKAAEGFLAKSGLPRWTKVERIVDGGETTAFKQYFTSWKEETESPYVGLGRVYPMETVAEWDIGVLHSENRRRLLSRSAGAAIGFMPDDSSGAKEIFRIEDLSLVPLDEEKYGFFFGGDSYVIKYTYETPTGTGYILYYWQGSASSQDERAASAICTVQMDNEIDGKAIQVRVVQGKEPRHFIKMFQGRLVIFTGGKASGFKNVHDHDTYDVDGTRLFRVRGTSEADTRAVQVEEKAASLNSEDVFVLETPNGTFVWNGRASSDEEKEIALKIAPLVSPDNEPQVIAEGEEPEEFWAGLGGQGEYQSEIDPDKPILNPRLFHVRKFASGFRAIEIDNFEQSDLIEEDVMILDSGAEIYVWIGNEADKSEKEAAAEMAKEYLRKDPTDRDESNTLIFTIKQGKEPKSFTCVFPTFE